MTTEQITIPRATFEQMREALEQVNYILSGGGTIATYVAERTPSGGSTYDALAAANAVGEKERLETLSAMARETHKTQQTFYDTESEKMRTTEVQPQAQGEVVAYQGRWFDLSTDKEGWSDWRAIDTIDLPRWQEKVSSRPDVYEMRALVVATHPTGPELFTPLARKKLEALQSQGFVINGYTVKKGIYQGFVTTWGRVGWHSTDTPPAIKESMTTQAWERCQWWQCGLAKRCVNQGQCGAQEQAGKEGV